MNNSNSLFKVRVYPSLDFTLGQKFPPKPDKDSNATEIKEGQHKFWHGSYKHYEIDTNESLNQRAVDSVTHGERLASDKAAKLLESFEGEYLDAVHDGDTDRADKAIAKIEALAGCPALLGLSVAINSRKVARKPRGLSGITPYGKRMVRSCLAVLERKHQRQALTLGTCTLPALTEDEFDSICSRWAEVVRRFFEELTREMVRRGLEPDYVQVTEIQERRFEQYGDVGLHLHWVIQGKRNPYAHWAFTPDEFKQLWGRILSNMLGREVDCPAATRVESLRTSLYAEMGKYLSKGCTAIQSVVKAGKSHQLPSAWWGAAKQMKTQVRSEIIEISGLAALWLDKQLKRFRSDRDLWYVDIWIEKDGREFRAGAVGRFNSQKEVDELKLMHEVLSIQDGHSILELFS